MDRKTYPDVITLLIIRIYTSVNTKRGIGPRVQLGIQSGIFGDGEQVQGLHIDPQPLEMQPLQFIGYDIVTDRQVSAPEEIPAFHDIGVEYAGVAEIGAFF